jgi:formylglycine-generating enzyme required for sulfatase activity
VGAGGSSVGTSLQDRTIQHALDLGGNVSEWVQDRFVETYPACRAPCKDPVNDIADSEAGSEAAESKADSKADSKSGGKSSKSKGGKSAKSKAKAEKASKAAAVAAVMRVVRGGNFDLAADACRGAGRSRLSQDEVSINIGFRCVRASLRKEEPR